MRKYGAFFIMFAAFLWSLDALLRKPLTDNLSSSVIVFYEHLFGVILLLPILLKNARQFLSLRRREWLAVLFIGIGGSALSTYFFTASFQFVSPSVAILLQKVQPIVAILMATALLREHLSRFFWIWAGVAMVGAYFISFPNGIGDLTVDHARGVYYALIAAFFWGGSTVMGRLVIRKMTFPTLTALRLTVALVFLVVFMTVQRSLSELNGVSGGDIGSLITITLFTGTGALLLYYFGLRSTKASVATIAELFFPFSAVIINWVFLDDALVTTQILGGVVLLLAIYMVQKVGKQPLEERPIHAVPAGSEAK